MSTQKNWIVIGSALVFRSGLLNLFKEPHKNNRFSGCQCSINIDNFYCCFLPLVANPNPPKARSPIMVPGSGTGVGVDPDLTI